MVAALAYTVNTKIDTQNIKDGMAEPEWNPYKNGVPNYCMKALPQPSGRDYPKDNLPTFQDILDEEINAANHDKTGATQPPAYDEATLAKMRQYAEEEERRRREEYENYMKSIPKIVKKYMQPNQHSVMMFSKLQEADRPRPQNMFFYNGF